MSSEDFGKDVVTVQTLLRKQEETEKDMSAVFQQIKVGVEIGGGLGTKRG